MSTPKKQAIKELSSQAVSNQQALVDKINGRPTIRNVKRIIPGGKTLHDQVPIEQFPKMFYTWLRHCREFRSFTVSFVKDPNQGTKRVKVIDYNPQPNVYEWDRNRREVASEVSKQMLKVGVVAIEGDKEGLYAYVLQDKAKDIHPTMDEWEPYVEFTPIRRSTTKKLG